VGIVGELPEPIRKTLAVMKSQSKHCVFVKFLYSNYRVYEGTSHYDKATRGSRLTAIYLGTIEADGKFVPATHRQDKSKIALAPEQIHLEKMNPQTSPEKLTEEERKTLMILSMNGRAKPKFVGSMLGMKPQAAQHLVKKLESRFRIRYFADIAFWKFGLNQFVGFIKFSDRIPSAKEIVQSLGGDPHVQLVALTSGDYDVLFYFLAESNDDACDITYKLQTTTKLADYDAVWDSSYFYQKYGAIPVRPEFFELLEKKVWHKTKETPTKKEEELWKREYSVLKELCRDGAMNFADIDKRNGLEPGSARYTFSKLKESGIIRRTTISMQNLPFKYNALMLANLIRGSQLVRTRDTFLSNMIQYTNHPINKYILMGETTFPRSALMIAPIFDEKELEEISELGKDVRGLRVRMLIISRILTGSLCYRLFDNEHSSQWELLVERKVLAPKTKTDYDETGRVRKKHIQVDKEQGIYGVKYK
jgi:DNA-binding Lrp family transcriptional regulator